MGGKDVNPKRFPRHAIRVRHHIKPTFLVSFVLGTLSSLQVGSYHQQAGEGVKSPLHDCIAGGAPGGRWDVKGKGKNIVRETCKATTFVSIFALPPPIHPSYLLPASACLALGFYFISCSSVAEPPTLAPVYGIDTPPNKLFTSTSPVPLQPAILGNCD